MLCLLNLALLESIGNGWKLKFDGLVNNSVVSGVGVDCTLPTTPLALRTISLAVDV